MACCSGIVKFNNKYEMCAHGLTNFEMKCGHNKFVMCGNDRVYYVCNLYHDDVHIRPTHYIISCDHKICKERNNTTKAIVINNESIEECMYIDRYMCCYTNGYLPFLLENFSDKEFNYYVSSLKYIKPILYDIHDYYKQKNIKTTQHPRVDTLKHIYSIRMERFYKFLCCVSSLRCDEVNLYIVKDVLKIIKNYYFYNF